MKISKLSKFAWAYFAFALSATTVFAQGWRYGNNVNNRQNGICLEQISDLNSDQKAKILDLEKNHQEKMTGLREKRRSTSDVAEKNQIRAEMLQNVEKHQTAVKNLLSENQQKEYDLLHFRRNNFRNQNSGNNVGRGRSGQCLGNGYNQQNNQQNFRCCVKNQRGKGNNRIRKGCGYNSSNS